jgi:hypothetical protein
LGLIRGVEIRNAKIVATGTPAAANVKLTGSAPYKPIGDTIPRIDPATIPLKPYKNLLFLIFSTDKSCVITDPNAIPEIQYGATEMHILKKVVKKMGPLLKINSKYSPLEIGWVQKTNTSITPEVWYLQVFLN